MSRPVEIKKKEELLERCLVATIEEGALNFSINAIAKKIGTSGRMLVYHFGSKQELERQIIGVLETRLRDKMWSIRDLLNEEADSLAVPLLKMWGHLTSSHMHGLLKLIMELNQRAIQGEVETRILLEKESKKWVDFFFTFTNDESTALSLFHLFQGAILDFLMTGNARRGEQTIRAFVKNLES